MAPAPAPAPGPNVATDRLERSEGTWYAHLAKCIAWMLGLVAPILLWSRWGPEVAPCTPETQMLPWLRGVALYYTAFGLASAGIVGHAGWLTLKSGRYPYPGQWSPLAVSRTGWWVKFNGWAHFLIAGALLWLLAQAWIGFDIAAVLGLSDTAPVTPNTRLE